MDPAAAGVGGSGGSGEGQSTAPRTRRPFQARRKERSCDSCKVRKTKCDSRDDTPCSACLVAKLPCVFSSTDHEGRKMGPTRRIRELERTVEELTQRLQSAGQQQWHCSECHHSLRTKGDMLPQDAVPGQVRSMALSILSSVADSYPDPAPNAQRAADSGSVLDNTHYPSPPPHLGLPALTGILDHHHQQHQQPQRQFDPQPFGPQDPNSVTWGPNTFGPGSAPQFIDLRKGYLQHHGVYAPHISGGASNMFEKVEAVPLLSDVIPQPGLAPSVDLRALLPPRPLAEKLLATFHHAIQDYMPIFYWPALLHKVDRAWASPIWEQDSKTVNEVFCVVMMAMAVGSQLAKAQDVGGMYFPPHASQERHGWQYFEASRRYLNLNNPVYSLEDATVLLLMSLYLDKAALPSPCWMICGAMARVCQDIGLHRQPPSGRFSDIELECRSRLFWAAYIQDKRVSMKMGRPWILRQDDCDVALPAAAIADDYGLGTALLHPQAEEEDDEDDEEDDEDDEGVSAEGGLSAAVLDSHELKSHRTASRRALKTVRAAIEACKVIEAILGNKLLPTDHPEHQIRGLQLLDGQLERCWEMLPAELIDLQCNEPLDLPSLRALLMFQHARLILFGHFTDIHCVAETARQRKMTAVFLKFCLDQSVRVALVTAQLMYRAQLNADFDDEFGVLTDALVHLHLFRVAVVLLLGLNLPETAAKQGDLSRCVVSLQAVAKVHTTGRRFLELFKEFAGLFGHPLSRAHVPAHHRTEIGQSGPSPAAAAGSSGGGGGTASTAAAATGVRMQQTAAPDWETEAAAAYPIVYSAEYGIQPGPSPPPPPPPPPHHAQFFAPQVLGRIGNGGDWSPFQDILQWNPDFEEALGGGGGFEWNS